MVELNWKKDVIEWKTRNSLVDWSFITHIGCNDLISLVVQFTCTQGKFYSLAKREALLSTVRAPKSLDGTYTRMPRKALNIHWSSHIPNQQLYGDLPAVSNKIASRRLQLAGHCYRHPELSTQKLVLWEPTHGHRGRGRPNTTYIDTLKRDTRAFEASEIAVLMADKRLWKDLVVARLRATKWVWVSGHWSLILPLLE